MFECIMKSNDFIKVETVNELGENQWNLFRKYLQKCGYNINGHFGRYSTSLLYPKGYVVLESGDLIYYSRMYSRVISPRKEITLRQILDAICTNNDLKISFNDIKRYVDMSSVKFTNTSEDKASWGGTWSYRTASHPNVTICGFKTKREAVYSWMKDEFGESGMKTIMKLIAENKKFSSVIENK